MRRREFVEKLGVGAGSAVAVAGGVLAYSGTATAQNDKHDHPGISGPLASATVSFGAWPPIDRLAAPPPGPPPNVHHLTPNVTTIKAGGTVNFIVAGFHNVAVYRNVRSIDDINGGITIPVPGAPMGFPPLVNDAVNRVFRGAASFTMPVDRVEVVHFPDPGNYLVICAFLPHFLEGMSGWVRVVR